MVESVTEEGVLAWRQESSEPDSGRGGDYDRPMVMSYMTMRKFVGGIGILLPFVLYVGNQIIGYGVQPSMSGYYYTPMRNIFIGALCALAIFLITYDGWDRADTVITNVAGIGTVGTALCPTSPVNATGHQAVVGIFHLSFAGFTFVLLAVMSLRFAKRVPTPAGLSFWQRVCYALGFTPPGSSRTTTAELVTYRVSGFTLLVCLALIYPMSKVYSDSLLVLEMIMLVSFGVAWLVKGTTLLRGKDGGTADATRTA
jgi:hypothetical protein